MHDLPPDSDSGKKQPQRPAQPYLDWALATGFSYLREGKWIPLLIEFDAKEARRPPGNERLSGLEAFATRRWLNNDPRTLNDEFVIPDLFVKPPELLRRSSDFNFCVGLIKRDVEVVRRLTQLDRWNRTILRVELGPPINFPNKTAPALKGPASGPTPPSPRSRAAPFGRRGIGSRKIAALQRGFAHIRTWFAASRSTGAATAGTPPPPSPPSSANPPGTPGSPSPGSPPTASPPGQSPGSRAGGGSAHQVDRVVIAVIDQGIAFANSRFFTGGVPRIEYLWQQNVLGTTIPAPGLTMPFTPGFELDKGAITNAVAAARVVGADDEWVYRNFGGLNFGVEGYKPLARRRTHGTHVLDLAASSQLRRNIRSSLSTCPRTQSVTRPDRLSRCRRHGGSFTYSIAPRKCESRTRNCQSSRISATVPTKDRTMAPVSSKCSWTRYRPSKDDFDTDRDRARSRQLSPDRTQRSICRTE